MSTDFPATLAAAATRIEAALDSVLVSPEGRLEEAMRYAVLGGGKRLRPAVLLWSAGLFGIGEAAAMPAACALELLHGYSLVHDDLPAMDDDDLRRGRPTVHRAFDEATAILAGDALLTLAFELILAPGEGVAPAVRVELGLALAQAAGRRGMVEGQMRDLAAERTRPTAESALAMQALKTGELFRFAALAGAILGGAGEDDRVRLARYGSALGRAFQIADDLLDEEATPEEVGKATAKDRDRGKATLPAILGPQAARQALQGAVAEAEAALASYGEAAETLRQAAAFAAQRRS